MRDEKKGQEELQGMRDPGIVPWSIRNSIAYQRLNTRQKVLYGYFRRKATEQEPPGYKPGVFLLDYEEIGKACGAYSHGNIGELSKDIAVLTRSGFITCLHLVKTACKLSCHWQKIGAAGKDSDITGGTS